MPHETTAPEVADRHRRHLVLAMLAMAVIAAANAAERLVSPETGAILRYVEVVTAGCLILALVPMAAWKFRNRDQSLRYVYLDESGFVAQTLHRAKNASWVATFVFLSGLAPFARRFDHVPSEFFVYLTTSVMLLVFVVVFFALNWSDSRDDEDVRASTSA